jgi:hypothetical protein
VSWKKCLILIESDGCPHCLLKQGFTKIQVNREPHSGSTYQKRSMLRTFRMPNIKVGLELSGNSEWDGSLL